MRETDFDLLMLQETYQFKTKKSEIRPYSLFYISKCFTAKNMKKTGLNGYVHEFSVDYNIIDASNITITINI